MNQPAEFLLVSNFNLSNFATLFGKDAEPPLVHAIAAPYGQVMQTLLHPGPDPWAATLTGAIVWTSPEGISANYSRLCAGEEVPSADLLCDVDDFCAALKKIPGHVNYIFIPAWPTGSYEGRLGLLDLDARRGISLALMRMNLRLAEVAQSDLRIVVLDTNRWVAVHGERSFGTRLWYMSKTPYTAEFFTVAVQEIKAAYRALRGQSRKLLVLDLDDTLWGGIVGDVGWQNLRLGGHDATGEAYVDFQRQLQAMKKRGVLLGIVSKNEETIAREAMRSHPEMILRERDFAGWRINWQDKAQNIADLVRELNLGLQSVVFIDDNPAERDRVRKALPDVFVPDWPANAMDFRAALSRLTCFDAPLVSDEDRRRTETYAAERMRQEERTQLGSVGDWLQTLAICVVAEPVSRANLGRTAQLFNKTNQMNLSTRRLSEEELWSWSGEAQNRLLAFRVSDKFGDYGLVGIASIVLLGASGQAARMVDFVLSCRVMGRAVEETMLHVLVEAARAAGARELIAEYLPTAKNQPCLRFLETAGFSRKPDSNLFMLPLEAPYPRPTAINLIRA